MDNQTNMSARFDLSDKDVGMKVLEDLTKNAKQIQDDMLEEIVTSNMSTEYLRRFLDGPYDKDLFKKDVPVVTYEDIKPYIDRIMNGEPSDLISARPITGFLRSSGTSGGRQKMLPLNNKHLENKKFIKELHALVRRKLVDGAEEGKGIRFFFISPVWKTPSGLRIMSSTSSYVMSDYYKNRPLDRLQPQTSPDEVFLCADEKQSLYCHLLCGLLQRDEVMKVGAVFASVLVRAIKFLEYHWKELCSDLRSGEVSEWITDIGCRNSVSLILERPHPELAEMLEQECDRKSWEGIITRLWPKTKCIETVITGSMAQYIPVLKFYCNSLPIVSPSYVSSETVFGINLDPLCKPEDVSYTFMPNMSYFEFLPVDGNDDEIVDLMDVKLGCCYEPVVTNFSGLYRIRVGDILQVTGFHNNTPRFKFVGRRNVILSVYDEYTTEEDLFKGVKQAELILDSSDLMLVDFTSYADISTTPGHYVLYWELKAKGKDGIPKLDHGVLTECCLAVEESLDALYRRCRSKDGPIGALEIRVVQQDTFDSVMDFFVSQGATSCQYKTPRCIKSPKALEVLEEKVVGRFFSQRCPSCDSPLYQSST